MWNPALSTRGFQGVLLDGEKKAETTRQCCSWPACWLPLPHVPPGTEDFPSPQGEESREAGPRHSGPACEAKASELPLLGRPFPQAVHRRGRCADLPSAPACPSASVGLLLIPNALCPQAGLHSPHPCLQHTLMWDALSTSPSLAGLKTLRTDIGPPSCLLQSQSTPPRACRPICPASRAP